MKTIKKYYAAYDLEDDFITGDMNFSSTIKEELDYLADNGEEERTLYEVTFKPIKKGKVVIKTKVVLSK